LTLAQDPIDTTRNLLNISDVNDDNDMQPNQLLLQLTQNLQKPDDESPLNHSSSSHSKSTKTPTTTLMLQQPINILRPISGDPKPRHSNHSSNSIQLPQLILQPPQPHSNRSHQLQQGSSLTSPPPQLPLQLNITSLDRDLDDLASTTLSLQFPSDKNDKASKRKFDLLFDDHRTEKQPKITNHHQHDISSYI